MKYFRGIRTCGVVSAMTWLGLVIACIAALTRHATTPGDRADRPAQGTTDELHSVVRLPDPDGWMLVFLHPRGTCATVTHSSEGHPNG